MKNSTPGKKDPSFSSSQTPPTTKVKDKTKTPSPSPHSKQHTPHTPLSPFSMFSPAPMHEAKFVVSEQIPNNAASSSATLPPTHCSNFAVLNLRTMTKFGVGSGDLLVTCPVSESDERTEDFQFNIVPCYCSTSVLHSYVQLDVETCKNLSVKTGSLVSVTKLQTPLPFCQEVTAIPHSVLPQSLNTSQIKFFILSALSKRVIRGLSFFITIPILGFPTTFEIVPTIPPPLIDITNASGVKQQVIAYTVTPFSTIELKVNEKKERKPTSIPLNLCYSDIAGCEKEIAEIKELVELPLFSPEVFSKFGIKPPKGVLLHGPPGTGKTLLAKVIISECLKKKEGFNFQIINGPELTSRFLGETEAKLRFVFKTAEENPPSAILIDEIDSLCPKRDTAFSEVDRRVVSTLLTLMDGISPASRVVVIATTNRITTIDPALRRGGRFDREIEMGPPTKTSRESILRNLLTKVSHNLNDEQIMSIASRAHGFVGADLRALCNEAAMKVVQKNYSLLQSLQGPSPSLVVSIDEMESAFASLRPSAMREVAIEIPKVSWKDIGGNEDSKQKLIEVVHWPLKHYDAFERMGISPPCGILLYGPSGCGKTLTAQALATESGLNFLAVKGPQLLSKWVGESERAVQEIFKKARQNSPSILLFDEIDGLVGGGRGDGQSSGVGERVLSQLLVEMDGVKKRSGVIVVAATNRPDLIDGALLRPGRLDRMLYMGLPDMSSREAILKIQLEKICNISDTSKDDYVDIARIAEKLDGYSGAEIVSVCRDASMIALRESFDNQKVHPKHLQTSLEALSSPSVTAEVLLSFSRFKDNHQ
eukprot:TRINITY_DN12129_c0_g1_i1.p1 TRINITY_DN12129_c0_g1~~TRINITY_DN12129_c0_g1_i1.p1  ORF type:complete len:820 (-),score=223.87 TRINITY_DN12129_c0_g1_i1:44-2503(-)